MPLTKFDDAISGLQPGFDFRPRDLESGQQCFGAAVSEADPDEPSRRGRPVGEVQEIFILANEDCVIRDCVGPDFGIGGIPQIQVGGRGRMVPRAQ